MANRLVLTVLVAMLAACSSDTQRARQLVADSLPITEDLEFHALRVYPGDVVCGEFSATTSYVRPREEHRAFIVRGDKLHKSPTDLDASIYCNNDPAGALLEHTGIGPVSADNPELAKVIHDYALIASALEAYYLDNYYYPDTEQGLEALVRQPQAGRRPPRYREGGYLTDVPRDPWNRAYIYTEEQWGRTKGHYEISTLGRSGAPGGEGAEADISSSHLTYLLHAARVVGVLQ
jgi:type II secretion system protein G